MLRFSIGINHFFHTCSIYERIQIAAKIGYDGVEIYRDIESIDPVKLRQAAQNSGIPIVNMAVERLDKNVLNQDLEALYPAVRNTLEFAETAGCKNIFLECGETVSPTDAPKLMIFETLKKLGSMAAEKGISLNIRPKSSLLEQSAQYLDSSSGALELVKSAGQQELGVLYDLYHMQIMEGNIAETIKRNAGWIKHILISGVPGHEEPFYGEVNIRHVLREIEGCFNGYCGLNYFPSYDSFESAADVLSFLKTYVKGDGYRGTAKNPVVKSDLVSML